MSLSLNINMNATVKLANKLEKINRYALPVAARESLNATVKDVKQVTMPAGAKSEFTQRQKNFFTANSKFEYAKGFSLGSMKATVGFYENRLANSATNFAVKDLEEQEHGGNIGGKAFIPMTRARISKRGNVKANARISAIRDRGGIIDATKVRSISGHSAPKLLSSVKKQKLLRAAFMAKKLYGDNAYILGNKNAAGNQTLFKVGEISSGLYSGKLNVNLIPLYSVRAGRSVNVKATHFMKEASLLSAKKMEGFFITQAQKQLKKHYGKL